MKNFLISSCGNLVLIFMSYCIFKKILNGSIRHKLYEKLMSSFALYVIYLFLGTLLITGVTTFILYKTWYVAYINIITPAVLSVFVGFIMCTVPTKGVGDEPKNI